MRVPLLQRTVSVRTAVLVCAVCLIFGGGAAFAGASTLHFFAPGMRDVIVGYGYTCQSTTNRPTFSCYFTLLHRAVATPIMSVRLGQRTMTVRSDSPPAVVAQGGTYRSTFNR